MTRYARCLFARLIHAPEISFCLCKCIILTLSPSFSPPAEPLSLMDLCRRSVRVALGRERLSEIHRLPLPASLKNYLLYQWRRRQSQHSEHTLISLCFSGIILGLNLFDSIAQASRTESASWFYEYASMSVAGLLFSYLVFNDSFSIVLSNFIKSGITEHYAHADPGDALAVTSL